MTVSSADLPVRVWVSIGMPRPLSVTTDAAVGLDDDVDAVAEAGHRLVDGVVDDLVDEVVQAALVGRADVHTGAAADGLQPFEDLDIGGCVLTLGSFSHVWGNSYLLTHSSRFKRKSHVYG